MFYMQHTLCTGYAPHTNVRAVFMAVSGQSQSCKMCKPYWCSLYAVTSVILQCFDARMVAWLNGSTLVSINEVTLCRARLVLGWMTIWAGKPPVCKPVTLANSAFYPQWDGK